jgi:hypothetical protein
MEQVLVSIDKYEEIKRKSADLEQALFSLDEAEGLLQLVMDFIEPHRRYDLLTHVYNTVNKKELDIQLFLRLKDYVENL